MSLLAADLGSSSCKAALFAAAGNILGRASQDYRRDLPGHNQAEMRLETFWDAFRRTVRSAAGHAGDDPVEALCISSHGETFAPVDGANQPVAPAILNIDNRATEQAEALEKLLGNRRIFEITGQVMQPMYPVPKLQWLRERRPETFQAARRFASVPDWILVRLGLPPYLDYSLASRFLAFDIRRKTWSEEILEAAGVSAARLPEPVPAGTVAGRLAPSAAAELAVPPGTPVVVGGHDQPCGALGMGIHEPGRFSDSMGTYECLLAASERPCTDDAAFAACLNSYCHVVPGQYVTVGYFPSGLMLQWLGDLLGGPDYAVLESGAPAGPTGLLVLPHLVGSGTPDFDPRASGAIVGLRPAVDRCSLYKGILEGLACEFAQVVKLLEAAAGTCPAIVVSGGGSRSRMGLELRAALSGRKLRTLLVDEAVCLGAAILAGVAAGTYSDYSQAVREVVRAGPTVEPGAALAAAYAGRLEAYRGVCSALAAARSGSRGASAGN